MNRERSRTRRVNENIKREEWENYFMGLLGSVGYKVVRENKRVSEKEMRKKG